MAQLKGTKTEANLMTAFAGESQAHTKYQYYASKAKKDGYVQMAAILKKRRAMKRSTQRSGSSFCTMTAFRRRWTI